MVFPLSIDIGDIDNGFLWLCLEENASTGKLILRFLTVIHPIFGEGNGTPFQYSCLENPTSGGAW